MTQPAYALVNGSVYWESPSERYNLRLWTKNLLDKRYATQGIENGLGDIPIYAPPRTYGLTLGVKFR